jgi:hypothetical protein
MRIARLVSVLAMAACLGSAGAQQQTAGRSKLDSDRHALVRFLLDAKQHTYASQGDEASVKPLLPGTHQLEYSAGPFFYRDIYAGSATFAGQEIVYYQQKPIWSMSYAGQVHDDLDPDTIKKVVALLHAALMHVTEEEPYRGPREHRLGGYFYQNRVDGKIENFYGSESISSSGKTLYDLRYGGGMLR